MKTYLTLTLVALSLQPAFANDPISGAEEVACPGVRQFINQRVSSDTPQSFCAPANSLDSTLSLANCLANQAIEKVNLQNMLAGLAGGTTAASMAALADANGRPGLYQQAAADAHAQWRAGLVSNVSDVNVRNQNPVMKLSDLIQGYQDYLRQGKDGVSPKISVLNRYLASLTPPANLGDPAVVRDRLRATSAESGQFEKWKRTGLEESGYEPHNPNAESGQGLRGKVGGTTMLDYLTAESTSEKGIVKIGRWRNAPTGELFNLNQEFNRLPASKIAADVNGMRSYGTAVKDFYKSIGGSSTNSSVAKLAKNLQRADFEQMSEADKLKLQNGQTVTMKLKPSGSFQLQGSQARAYWKLLDETHNQWVDKKLLDLGVEPAKLSVVRMAMNSPAFINGADDLNLSAFQGSSPGWTPVKTLSEALKLSENKGFMDFIKVKSNRDLLSSTSDLFRISPFEVAKDGMQTLSLIEADVRSGGRLMKGQSIEPRTPAQKGAVRAMRGAAGLGAGFLAGWVVSDAFLSQTNESLKGDYSCTVNGHNLSDDDSRSMCLLLSDIKANRQQVNQSTCEFISGVMEQKSSSPAAPAAGAQEN